MTNGLTIGWLTEYLATDGANGEKYVEFDIARQLKTLLETLAALAPFEVVQGDAIHRVNPTSRQVVNSSCAWAVSRGERSAHKTRTLIEVLNKAVVDSSEYEEAKAERAAAKTAKKKPEQNEQPK